MATDDKMNPSNFQKSDFPDFPLNRPTSSLTGHSSSIRFSHPLAIQEANHNDIFSAKQQITRKSRVKAFKVVVAVVVIVLILGALAVALSIIITQRKSQSEIREFASTSSQNFETTSSLKAFDQSTTMESSFYTSTQNIVTSNSDLKTSVVSADSQISKFLLQSTSQSSSKSNEQTTTTEAHGYYSVTSKSFNQTSRSFYNISTSNPQTSSTVSVCQVFCAPTNACIPSNQVCDKTQDCPDDSDEINCICDSAHYPCKNGRCIYKSWLCDGVKDCPMGDDESSSRCGSCDISTDFNCTKPPGCITSNKRCNGVTDCLDSSDESHCVSGFNGETDSSNTFLLLFNFKGIPGYYICSDNWNETWSDSVCMQMGLEQSNTTSYETVNSESFLALNLSVSSSNLMAYFQPTNCSSGKAVAVSCKPFACGTRSVSLGSVGPYILNGQQVKRGAWPWFALHSQGVYSSDSSFSQTASCGSVLVNNRWILTAAHCNVVATTNLGYTGQLRPDNIQISLGLITRSGSDDSMNARVDKVFMHPLYNTTPSTINDVGLLRLSEPLNFTDTIRPICLPSANEDLNQIRICVDTGFGRTLRNEPSYYLLQARMNILSYTDCYNYIKNTFLQDQSQFCAGTLPSQADINFCIGDSGGPLSCQDQNGIWKVLGINSYVLGQNNNQANDTCVVSVVSRITYFLDWIQQTIEANSV